MNVEALSSAETNIAPGLPANCWTPERQKMKDWLTESAPSLGELYEGAVRILFELRPPGYPRFVTHAVREIANGLPFVIFGIRSGEKLDPTPLLDKVTRQWRRAGFATDGTLAGFQPSQIQTEQGHKSLGFHLC